MPCYFYTYSLLKRSNLVKRKLKLVKPLRQKTMYKYQNTNLFLVFSLRAERVSKVILFCQNTEFWLAVIGGKALPITRLNGLTVTITELLVYAIPPPSHFSLKIIETLYSPRMLINWKELFSIEEWSLQFKTLYRSTYSVKWVSGLVSRGEPLKHSFCKLSIF